MAEIIHVVQPIKLVMNIQADRYDYFMDADDLDVVVSNTDAGVKVELWAGTNKRTEQIVPLGKVARVKIQKKVQQGADGVGAGTKLVI